MGRLKHKEKHNHHGHNHKRHNLAVLLFIKFVLACFFNLSLFCTCRMMRLMLMNMYYLHIWSYQNGFKIMHTSRLVLLKEVVYNCDAHLFAAGYRAKFTLKLTLLSLFKMHNETINVWTHLIGFLVMLGITISTTYRYWDSHWVDKTVSFHFSFNFFQSSFEGNFMLDALADLLCFPFFRIALPRRLNLIPLVTLSFRESLLYFCTCRLHLHRYSCGKLRAHACCAKHLGLSSFFLF